jgi:hypothetical protein
MITHAMLAPGKKGVADGVPRAARATIIIAIAPIAPSRRKTTPDGDAAAETLFRNCTSCWRVCSGAFGLHFAGLADVLAVFGRRLVSRNRLALGDTHGSRNSALDARCADSHHPAARDVFARLSGAERLMNTPAQRLPIQGTDDSTVESSVSAVSWSAILAGAFAAVSTTLILLAIGSGLGLASMSPWPEEGISPTGFTIMTAVWLVVVQWLSSGIGGYLTGRLRTKWTGTHTHEVFFRDTAHGFVTWAVGTVIVVAVLASAATAAIGTGVKAASTVGSGIAQATADAVGGAVSGYDVDSLFRSAEPAANATPAETHAEAGRILAKGVTSGDLPAPDRAYLARLIAAQTGISQQEAEQRLDQSFAQLKSAAAKTREAADAARKAGALASLYTALSMLIGAFIACVAAAIGGSQRDEHR